MPKIDDAAVRAAAMNAGYSAERAMMKGCWRLRDDDGKRAINPATKASALRAAEVIGFTKRHHADLGLGRTATDALCRRRHLAR